MRLSEDGYHYLDDEGNRYDRVSRVLEATGATAHYGFSRNTLGLEIGRAAHRAAELINRRLIDPSAPSLDETTLHTTIVPYVGAYRGFLRLTQFMPIACEVMLGSIYGFAGTLDAVGMLNGRLVILDFKTGQSIDPGSEYQQCAYELLWNENHPGELIEAKFILHLKPSRKFSLKPVLRPPQDFLDVYQRFKDAA